MHTFPPSAWHAYACFIHKYSLLPLLPFPDVCFSAEATTKVPRSVKRIYPPREDEKGPGCFRVFLRRRRLLFFCPRRRRVSPRCVLIFSGGIRRRERLRWRDGSGIGSPLSPCSRYGIGQFRENFWENIRTTYVSFSCFVPRITSLNVIIDTFFVPPPGFSEKRKGGNGKRGKMKNRRRKKARKKRGGGRFFPFCLLGGPQFKRRRKELKGKITICD